ncbi:hypothetical protein ACT4S5_01715 [Kocuria oceani]|uniref:hypothetical protein n=1 Tax=Kocuria oceani TaxID=988827 RepID=UPI0040359BB7
MRARDVRIGTVEQAAQARPFHGVMIAYCPDPVTLAAADALPGPRGLVAVALHNAHLVDWVAAHGAQYLGGDTLAFPPRGRTALQTCPARPLQPSP